MNGSSSWEQHEKKACYAISFNPTSSIDSSTRIFHGQNKSFPILFENMGSHNVYNSSSQDNTKDQGIR